jgi:hypothetical protein
MYNLLRRQEKTHHMQPCDMALMFPLKTYQKQETETWLDNNLSRVVPPYLVSKLSGLSCKIAATMSTSVNAFQNSGLCSCRQFIFRDQTLQFIASMMIKITMQPMNQWFSVSLVTQNAVSQLQALPYDHLTSDLSHYLDKEKLWTRDKTQGWQHECNNLFTRPGKFSDVPQCHRNKGGSKKARTLLQKQKSGKKTKKTKARFVSDSVHGSCLGRMSVHSQSRRTPLILQTLSVCCALVPIPKVSTNNNGSIVWTATAGPRTLWGSRSTACDQHVQQLTRKKISYFVLSNTLKTEELSRLFS